MPKPKATFLSLPTEIITSIFTLSSNPALVLTCRELRHILAPLSKSVATRIEFLLLRYNHNYVKAVVKGLRWAFFDIELLDALDRHYWRERTRILEAATSRAIMFTTVEMVTTAAGSGLRSVLLSSSKRQLQATPETPSTATSAAPSTAIINAPSSRTSKPPKKKRKKYEVPAIELPVSEDHIKDVSMLPIRNQSYSDNAAALPDTTSLHNQEQREIPLPKDFPMPRRLFKSEAHLPMITILLSRGASPSHPSHYPLVRASQRGYLDMVKLLLAYGAPPEMKALRWACVGEHDEILDVFLDHGVKPDQECLSWCVEHNKTRMVDRLLALGVVPDMKTVLGF